jgi:hypothetical protein
MAGKASKMNFEVEDRQYQSKNNSVHYPLITPEHHLNKIMKNINDNVSQ